MSIVSDKQTCFCSSSETSSYIEEGIYRSGLKDHLLSISEASLPLPYSWWFLRSYEFKVVCQKLCLGLGLNLNMELAGRHILRVMYTLLIRYCICAVMYYNYE